MNHVCDFDIDSQSYDLGRNVRKRTETTTVRHTIAPAANNLHHPLLHVHDKSLSRPLDFNGGRNAYMMNNQSNPSYTHVSREIAMPNFIRHETQPQASQLCRNTTVSRPSEEYTNGTSYPSIAPNPPGSSKSPFKESRTQQQRYQRFGNVRFQSQQNASAAMSDNNTHSKLNNVALFRSKLMTSRQNGMSNDMKMKKLITV